jgi:hypothetical protein
MKEVMYWISTDQNIPTLAQFYFEKSQILNLVKACAAKFVKT